MEIAIDASLQRQLDKLSETEREYLEESLLSEGCREPLTVWATNFQSDCCQCEAFSLARLQALNETIQCTVCKTTITRFDSVLIDGHNRFELCQKHQIEFAVQLKLFASRGEAEDWIDRNQLGKRNLSPDAFRIVAGRIYLRRKRKHGNEGGSMDRRLKHQNDALTNGSHPKQNTDTAAEVAKELGVSKATIQRNAQRAELHDQMLSRGDPEAAIAARLLPQRDLLEAKRLAAQNPEGDDAVVLAQELKRREQYRDLARSSTRTTERRPISTSDVPELLSRLDDSSSQVRTQVFMHLAENPDRIQLRSDGPHVSALESILQHPKPIRDSADQRDSI